MNLIFIKLNLGNIIYNLYLVWYSVFNWEEIIYGFCDFWGWCYCVYFLFVFLMLIWGLSNGIRWVKKINMWIKVNEIGLDCISCELKCFFRKLI